MPKARLKPCAQPGCPELQAESRCTEHRRDNDRYRRQSGTNRAEPRDRARRADTVAEHRATYGDWCPGWGREPHAADDLTADHIEEIAYGGDDHGDLQVLCRSCNGRKAAMRRAHPVGDPEVTAQTLTLAKGNSYRRELDDSCGDEPLTCHDVASNTLASAEAAHGWGVSPDSRSASDPCQGDSQSADLSCVRTGSR